MAWYNPRASDTTSRLLLISLAKEYVEKSKPLTEFYCPLPVQFHTNLQVTNMFVYNTNDFYLNVQSREPT